MQRGLDESQVMKTCRTGGEIAGTLSSGGRIVEEEEKEEDDA
jgi:hypothetical protein